MLCRSETGYERVTRDKQRTGDVLRDSSSRVVLSGFRVLACFRIQRSVPTPSLLRVLT